MELGTAGDVHDDSHLLFKASENTENIDMLVRNTISASIASRYEPIYGRLIQDLLLPLLL